MATKQKAVDDYRALDDDALLDKIADEEARMKKIKFSHAVSPIENPLHIRAMRRGIARLKTEVRKRELGL